MKVLRYVPNYVRTFRPSVMSQPCPRQRYLGMKGTKPAFKFNGVLAKGTQIHQQIEALLMKHFNVLLSEVAIYGYIDEYTAWKGHPDAVVEVNGLQFVIEIKSMNSKKFEELEQPTERHIMQLQVYMHCTRVPRGMLIYINSDTMETKFFTIKYDERRYQEMVERCKNFERDREVKDTRYCENCLYEYACKGKNDEGGDKV